MTYAYNNQIALLYCVKHDVFKTKTKKFEINDQASIYEEETTHIGYGFTIHNLTGSTMIDKGNFAYEFKINKEQTEKIIKYVKLHGI